MSIIILTKTKLVVNIRFIKDWGCVLSTADGLLREFGAAEVELVRVCDKYLGMSVGTAKKYASLSRLPVPAYRTGTQKSPWLVDVTDLAAHIDRVKADARRLHERVNCF